MGYKVKRETTYKCKHFEIHELVPKAIFEARGEKAWELLDERMLITLDRLRERYGAMYMNNYFWGGDDQWRGLRTPDSPYYSPTSQHSYGRGADPLFKHVSADKVRHDIDLEPDDLTFEFISSYELDVAWFHFDVRNCDRIKTYTP